MPRTVRQFFRMIFDIHDGKEQEEKIVTTIRKNVEFQGASLWTLIFAIFIASIGLNINSIPIVIGAMLISPLMGPIVGLGLSLGINDSHLLRKSLWNLAIATVISVIISTIYFYLSPINSIQSELLARTSPTIYDVLIAFFGGLAGVVGSSRAEKGNVIPGVAIATALMPPLCTVGYGIATGQPVFVFGAFYLYAINCIFICLATLLGVKYLHLPSVAALDERQERFTRHVITAIVVSMIIPATYFAYAFVQQNNFTQNAERYVKDLFDAKGYVLVYKRLEYESNPHRVELAFLSKRFTAEEIAVFESLLPTYGLSKTELIVRQDSASFSEAEWTEAIASIQNETERVRAIEAKLANGFASVVASPQLFAEAKLINPKVLMVAAGNLSFAALPSSAPFATSSTDTTFPVAIAYSASQDDPFSNEEKSVLSEWFKVRMQNDTLQVYFLTQ